MKKLIFVLIFILQTTIIAAKSAQGIQGAAESNPIAYCPTYVKCSGDEGICDAFDNQGIWEKKDYGSRAATYRFESVYAIKNDPQHYECFYRMKYPWVPDDNNTRFPVTYTSVGSFSPDLSVPNNWVIKNNSYSCISDDVKNCPLTELKTHVTGMHAHIGKYNSDSKLGESICFVLPEDLHSYQYENCSSCCHKDLSNLFLLSRGYYGAVKNITLAYSYTSYTKNPTILGKIDMDNSIQDRIEILSIRQSSSVVEQKMPFNIIGFKNYRK